MKGRMRPETAFGACETALVDGEKDLLRTQDRCGGGVQGPGGTGKWLARLPGREGGIDEAARTRHALHALFALLAHPLRTPGDAQHTRVAAVVALY